MMEAIGDALLDWKWLIEAKGENYRKSVSYPSYFSGNFLLLNKQIKGTDPHILIKVIGTLTHVIPKRRVSL